MSVLSVDVMFEQYCTYKLTVCMNLVAGYEPLITVALKYINTLGIYWTTVLQNGMKSIKNMLLGRKKCCRTAIE